MSANINKINLDIYGFICPTESSEGPKCGMIKCIATSYLNEIFTQNIFINNKYTKRRAK
nr:hypothetical protein [Megavirus caiporensis]